MSKLPEQMRLDRLLANMGYGSRRDIQQWVRAKSIILDGQVLQNAEQRVAVSPDLSQRMLVLGKPLDPPPGIILMLHKPLGVTCSHKEIGPLVYDLLPDRWRARKPAISTVGRLDKDTSGLLLMTDDGALLHRLISPRSHSPKQYCATLARPLRGDEAQIFASGALVLESEEKPLLPALLEVLTADRVRVTLTEGRYHQVRRMFAALGNHVLTLHRDKICSLELPPDLTAGSYRLLTSTDLAELGA